MKMLAVILVAALAITGCSSASEEPTGDDVPAVDTGSAKTQGIDACLEMGGYCIGQREVCPGQVAAGPNECTRGRQLCCVP
ncbi:hypothetical protein LVJ94_03670 [Pendulispora rubella]|uniref:Lipoprotein n=1 Tax=Pendulispora rubella TaxID=2741070 RepID=A0ABZ2L9U3_9BACT